LYTIRCRAVEWYTEEDSLEDNSPMDTNQSGDLYQKHNVGLEKLEDWKDTIFSEEVQVDLLSKQGDWGMSGYW